MEEAHAERTRRHEVSRALAGVNLPPEKEEAVERLSRSLVGKLLCGPVFKVSAPTETLPSPSSDVLVVGFRPASEKACSEARRHPCES